MIFICSYFRDTLTGTDSLNNYAAFRDILRDSSDSNYETGYLTLVRLFQTFSTEYMNFVKLCTIIILLPIFYVLKECPYRFFLLTLFALGELNATFDVLKGFISFVFVIIGFYICNMREKMGLWQLYYRSYSTFLRFFHYCVIHCQEDYNKKRIIHYFWSSYTTV